MIIAYYQQNLTEISPVSPKAKIAIGYRQSRFRTESSLTYNYQYMVMEMELVIAR
jgi:hypothetical protein